MRMMNNLLERYSGIIMSAIRLHWSTYTEWGGNLLKRFLRPLGCSAAAMLPEQARGTFRKHITKRL